MSKTGTTVKYKTVKELAEAFRTGELDRERYVLILDNDSSHLSDLAPRPEGMTDAEWEAEGDRRWEVCETLFSGKGYGDLQEAMEAAGIPTDWC